MNYVNLCRRVTERYTIGQTLLINQQNNLSQESVKKFKIAIFAKKNPPSFLNKSKLGSKPKTGKYNPVSFQSLI